MQFDGKIPRDSSWDLYTPYLTVMEPAIVTERTLSLLGIGGDTSVE